jgi:hypothetical protein
MQEAHEDPVRDPGTGYASADVLDPEAEVNRDHSQEGRGEELQDAMHGYASADTLDPASGYASADVLDTAPGDLAPERHA